jgi:4-hydroxybenzoate polyprenyltransferase
MIGILRPVNLLLLLAVQFTLWYKLCTPNYDISTLLSFFLFSFSVICTAAAGYVINDIIDTKTDLINKNGKVYIDIKISKKNAILLYYLLNIFALASAIILLDFVIISFTVVAIFLLYIYSKSLKSTVLIGNMTIALLSALPVLEIYYFFKPLNVDNEFFAYALFAFLTTLLREIVKDKEDSNGDLKSGIKTLANTISDSELKMVLLTVNSALLICLVGFLFFLNDFTMLTFWVYMVIMILPALLIFVLIYKLKNHTYSRLSLFIKVYMFLGLIRLWI